MNTKDLLSRKDHLQIEAYRTHNQWNDHDGKNMMLMDVILGAIAAALLFRDLTTILNTALQKVVATLFLFFLLFMWGVLYWKFSKRMGFRYNKMRTIEGSLGFRCHKDIKTYIDTHCLQKKIKFRDFRVGASVLLLVFVIVSLWGEELWRLVQYLLDLLK